MNQSKADYVVVDAGNTRTKVAVFRNDEITNIYAIENESKSKLFDVLKSLKSKQSILSGVVNTTFFNQIKACLEPSITLSYSSPLPISINTYRTIESLGVDRIANVVAAHSLSNHNHALVIDVGTCLKFDFITGEGEYQGGSIAPGIKMRLKALNHFTGKLPLIQNIRKVELIGQSTEESILSGVINGLFSEIKGFINEYKRKYPELTIFLTGGDLKRFDKGLKNTIFVNKNLTLVGLYLILKHNAA